MCLLLRMNQRRSDSFWMLKARRTASVWLINLSLYAVYFHVIAAQTYQLKSGMLPIKCTTFNGFYFSVTIVATTISLFTLQTHKIPRKGRIITRRQHMKPHTVLPVIAHAFIRQTKHKHGHCYKTKISPYLVTCPPNKDVDLCPFLK